MGSQQHVVGWRMKLEEEAFCCVCLCVCVYVYVCLWWWTQLIRNLEFLSVSFASCLEEANATMSESPNDINFFARGFTIINPRELKRERERFLVDY